MERDLRAKLRGFGYVNRMKGGKLPKKIMLYGEEGRRPIGRTRKK